MKLLAMGILLTLIGCGTHSRIPASEINNVQAQEQGQERYIYGNDAFAREAVR
jgi:hypothetical protein